MVRKGLRGEKAAEVEAAVKDGVKRLLRPAAERETRASFATTRSVARCGLRRERRGAHPRAAHAPGRARRRLDPAHRTGCKIAAVSATGAVPRRRRAHPRREDADAAGGGDAGGRFRKFCERHGARGGGR